MSGISFWVIMRAHGDFVQFLGGPPVKLFIISILVGTETQRGAHRSNRNFLRYKTDQCDPFFLNYIFCYKIFFTYKALQGIKCGKFKLFWIYTYVPSRKYI